MTLAYLNLGSNQERERNLRSAIDELKQQFHVTAISPVYESQAVGFKGNSFYNLCVAIETELSPRAINDILHRIEDQHGRDRSQPKFSGRTLDIDLILYGDAVINEDKIKLPREDILKYAFVLKPLVDIAPNGKHPQQQKSYGELWKAFNKESQSLRQIELQLSDASNAL